MNALTQKLLKGVADLKTNPSTQVVGGVYREVFQIFLTQTVGDINLSLPENLQKAEEALNKLPSVSEKLDDLGRIYKTAENHCDFGQHELKLDKNQGVSSENLQIKGADLIAKSVAHVTIATNLPQPHQGDPRIIQRLSGQVFSQTKTLGNPNLQADLSKNINSVISEVKAPPLPQQTIDNLSDQAVKAVTKQGVGPSGKGGFALLATAALLIASLNRQEETEETPASEQEETGIGQSPGMLFGAGYLALRGLGLTKKGAEKEEPAKPTEETTPPPTPIIVPRATLVTTPPAAPPPTAPTGTPSLPVSFLSRLIKPSSLFSKVGGFFKGKAIGKALGLAASTVLTGGLAAATKVITTLLSVFGVDIPLGKMTLYAVIIVLLVVLVPIFLTIYILTTHNTTPFAVDKISTSLPSFDISSTPPEQTEGSPAPSVSASPTEAAFSENEPHGFPLNSSCVTTLPGQLTHAANSLNAVDFGNIASLNSWLVRATHPGKVLYAGSGIDRYGEIVMLESLDESFITYYSHLEYAPLYIKEGDVVKRGQVLARVDNTGFSTGDHLHYELRGPINITPGPDYALHGTKTGKYGETGTILNFIPGKQTWDCNPPAN